MGGLINKENYKAWQIDENEFPKSASVREKIIFLLGYAILAPSAHNTQPWLFSVVENKILFFLNNDRILSKSDPSLRQTYISIGACIENFLIASDYFGLTPSIEYCLIDYDNKKKLVAEVVLDSYGKHQNTNKNIYGFLLPSINKRHSGKLDYIEKKLEFFDKEQLSILNSFPDLNLTLIDEKKKISAAASLIAEGTRRAMRWKDFIKELKVWVKPNWTKAFDGMPGNTVGMPGLISWLFPKIVEKIDVSSVQEKMMKRLVEKTTTVGVINVLNQNPSSWISCGRLFQRVSLLATKKGMATAAMGAPVEFADLAKKLGDLSEKPGIPAIFFRIGTPKKAPKLTPRMPLQQVIV